jgi:hypothetical protein
VLSVLPLTCAMLCLAASPGAEPAAESRRAPRIHPDYREVTVPPNIAPLNFLIREAGTVFQVEMSAVKGAPVTLQSRTPKICIPAGAWRTLLRENKGEELRLIVRARFRADQDWTEYAAITNYIAPEEIDPVLMYRKIGAVHGQWSEMALYERDLQSFEETPFLQNQRFASDCCHCHTPHGGQAERMTVVIRSRHYENRLLIVSSNAVIGVRGSVGWTAWHPSGQIIASSFSTPRLIYHSARKEMRDVAELQGWIGYFRPGEYRVRPVPGLDDRSRLNTFPAWSPDGAYLYFCSSPNPWTNMNALTAVSHKTAMYDLMRVAHDVTKDSWGQPEVVVSARAAGFSCAQPRISPDGRWLFFCGPEYGCWPVYDETSDLWGLDLRAGQANGQFAWRKLELNSPASESLVSWSSNSRWVVFSSKRMSPPFSRPHIAYVKPDGTCGRPFVVPQADPEYYDSVLKTYTIPVLATGPITVPQKDLVSAIRSPKGRTLLMPESKPGDNSR